LTKYYETLQSKYDKVVNENLELNNFFEEFDVLTKDYETLQSNYETLQSKYDTVVSENLELKSIFEYIENISDSDEQ
jgi:prefoldin subunit 5